MPRGCNGGNIRENARIGDMAERAVRQYYESNCDVVRPTGVGSDFFASGCRNPRMDGYHEAKANDAPLSPLQQDMQRRYGPRYHVDRASCDSSGCEYSP